MKYRFLSTCRNVEGRPRFVQPALFCGGGKIKFGSRVCVGWNPSPFLYSGYAFIAAMQPGSMVEVGDEVAFNNNAVIYSLGAGIKIGRGTIAGTGLEVYDSDFHGLSPEHRSAENAVSRQVTIGENVFIGSNVKILKGVTIGNDSVIGNSSVVTRSFPERSVLAGNPARLIKTL